MRKILFALCLAGCSSIRSVDLNLAETAIRSWHLRLDPEPLARVEVTPVPGRPDLFLAICDTQAGWWGSFGLYHLAEAAIDWEGTCSDGPDEQSIHRIRVVQVPGFRGPLVEVFGMTHMGNGNLYLYELQGKAHLQLLIKNKAVDSHCDGETFRGGHLEATYRDENGDGSVDLVLSGDIEEWDEKGIVVLRSRPCRRVFLWNSALGRFQ